MFLALTQLRYRYTIAALPYSAQQVGCLYIISPLHAFNYMYHQLAPIVGRRRTIIHAIANKLHFALHAMAMFIVRTWIVHLTVIPYSTFALI